MTAPVPVAVYRVGPSPFYRWSGGKEYDTTVSEGDLVTAARDARLDDDGDLTVDVIGGTPGASVSPECLNELVPDNDREVVDVEDLAEVWHVCGGRPRDLRKLLDLTEAITAARG